MVTATAPKPDFKNTRITLLEQISDEAMTDPVRALELAESVAIACQRDPRLTSDLCALWDGIVRTKLNAESENTAEMCSKIRDRVTAIAHNERSLSPLRRTATFVASHFKL